MAAGPLEALATEVFVTCPSGVFVATSVFAFFGGFSFEIAKESMVGPSERSAMSDRRFRGIVDATASALTRTWALLRLETRCTVGLVEDRRFDEEPMETHFSLEDILMRHRQSAYVV